MRVSPTPKAEVLAALVIGLFLAVRPAAAVPPASHTVIIVGPGVTSCAEFLAEATQSAERELRYFAWAQGYMSGILMRAPPGKDEHLNLLTTQFPVVAQIRFLRDYCADHLGTNYEDAVAVLYRKLRTFSPAETGQSK